MENQEIHSKYLKIATITQEGINLDGVFFSCGYAIKNNWFVQNKNKYLVVVFHPEDTSKIYIPNKSEIIIANALNPIQIIDEIHILEYQTQLCRLKELLNKRRK